MTSAEPVLASSLWIAQQLLEGSSADGLLSGCRSVDDILGRGLAYGGGGVCCLSFEDGTSKHELMNSFLTHHLLHHPLSRATLVGHDRQRVLSLFSSIKAWLVRQPYDNPNLPSRDINAEAQALLGRVDFSPVFDFTELLEALAELRSRIVPSPQTQTTPPGSTRSTVPDSDDSDEDLIGGVPPRSDTHDEFATRDMALVGAPTDRPPHLIIISDLPTLLLPLQRANHVHSSAILSSLLRILRHLCIQSRSACLLVNGTTSSSPTAIGNKLGAEDSDLDGPGPRSVPTDGPSAFTSCTARPLFHRVLGPSLDTHVLIHLVPRRSEDARVAYGGTANQASQARSSQARGERVTSRSDEAEREAGRSRHIRARRSLGDARRGVSCFEVLADRHGMRSGRFGFYGSDGVGLIMDGLV